VHSLASAIKPTQKVGQVFCYCKHTTEIALHATVPQKDPVATSHLSKSMNRSREITVPTQLPCFQVKHLTLDWTAQCKCTCSLCTL